jgi:hypothetical protein
MAAPQHKENDHGQRSATQKQRREETKKETYPGDLSQLVT